MNERELTSRLEQAVPEVPVMFHNAMLGAFAQIQEQEEQEKKQAQESRIVRLPAPRLKKRTAAIILIAALLMATVAVAATLMPRLLTVFWGENVTMRDDFLGMIQYNVAEEMVGDSRVRIEEVVYDGVSLYVTWSIRNMTVDKMIGDPKEDRLLDGDEYAMVISWDGGFWTDSLWINGHEIDMPSMSGGMMYGGDEPGEVVFTELYRLDQEDVILGERTRVAMPIGENQHWTYETLQSMPRLEDGTRSEPEEGCLVFYLNSNVENVTRLGSGEHVLWDDGTEVWVESAIFTPIKLYMAISYNVPEQLVEEKLESNRDALEWGNEEIWWDISALDATSWVYDLMLVDGQGRKVDAQMDFGDGLWSHGSSFADFVFPYMETYPSPLYIAPVVNGEADMTRKVLVRE